MRLQHLIAVVFGLTLLLPSAVAAQRDLNPPAAGLRIALDRLLAEHIFLTLQAMQAGVDERADFAAAAEALEANTRDLTGAIEEVYGSQAGREFGDLWRDHIGFMVDYARAHAAGDEAAKELAAEELEQFQGELGAFLATANPHLTADAAEHLLENHLDQLQRLAELETGDYAAAYAALRAGYRHMYELGDALARAIVQQFPEQLPGQRLAFGPATDLRVTLDLLLGEHALLAIEVMRQRTVDDRALDASASALAENSDAIEQALTGIYGSPAARDFVSLWNEHNGHYLDYVSATLAEDATGRGEAISGLNDINRLLSEFLASANPLLAADDLESAFGAHTQHLIDQVDAYHGKDFSQAYAITREAYSHMSDVSEVLAAAIAHQFPERFLPDTATHEPLRHRPLTLLGLIALWASGVVIFRRALLPRRSARGEASSSVRTARPPVATLRR